MRANRATVINLQAIRPIAPSFSGGLKAVLTGGEEVEFSRRQTRVFRERRGI